MSASAKNPSCSSRSTATAPAACSANIWMSASAGARAAQTASARVLAQVVGVLDHIEQKRLARQIAGDQRAHDRVRENRRVDILDRAPQLPRETRLRHRTGRYSDDTN